MKGYPKLFLALLLLLPTTFILTQNEVAQKVALDLFHATGEISKERPEVTITAGLALPVQVDTKAYSIQLEKKALDLCLRAADSKDALAMILAPAITELYLKDIVPDQQVTEGALISYLGGYQTLDTAVTQRWEELYRIYPRLADNLPMASRKEQLVAARTELDNVVPLFELANFFTILGQYEYAGEYYAQIGARFPSREIYSNAGVCKALQALELFGIAELKYVYPFVVDLDFRAGQKGEKEVRDSLLLAAAADFREAVRRDPDYAIGYVNLSCTQSLMGDFSAAIANAQKARKLAAAQELDRVTGSALIAEGIALAQSDDQAGADAAFAQAADIEDETVRRLVLLNQGEELPPTEENTSFFDEESIGSTTLESMAAQLRFGGGLEQPYLVLPGSGNTNLFIKEDPQFFLLIQQDTLTNSYWFFQSTEPGYTGQSLRDIQLGSDITEVLDAYGDPAVIRKFGRGKCYYYQQSGIIFLLDEKDTVARWTLFHDP